LIVINVSQSAAGREQPASVRETGALALMAFLFIAAAGLFFSSIARRTLTPDDRKKYYRLSGGYNHDSASIRRPFDCRAIAVRQT